MQYSAKDFPIGSTVLAVKQGRNVTVEGVKSSGGMTIVKVKGLMKDDPDRVIPLAAESGEEVYLKPIKIEGEFFEEQETEPDTEEPEAVAEIEATTEIETEIKDKTEDVLEKWLALELTEEQYNKTIETNGIDFARLIVGKLSKAQEIARNRKAKPRETDFTKAKLNKFWQAGEYVPIADWLTANGHKFSEESETGTAVEAFLADSRAISNAAQYTGEGIKVKAQLINTSATEAYTEMYRRLVEFYPIGVKLGLVRDIFIMKEA